METKDYSILGQEIRKQAISVFEKVFDTIDSSPKKEEFGTLFSMINNIRKGSMGVGFVENILRMTGVSEDQVNRTITLLKILRNESDTRDDHDEFIEIIVNETHDYWDYVKERDEERILDISNEQIRDCGNDSVSQFGEKLFNHVLKHRCDFFTKEFEEGLWEEGDSLIRKVIQYVHLRRNPKRNTDGVLEMKTKADGSQAPIYQTAYASKISVTKNAKTWGVELV